MSGFFRRLLKIQPGLPGVGAATANRYQHELGADRLELSPLEPGPPLTDAELPRVGLVILNYNGRHHLERCFKSLSELDYPEQRLEVLLVDNGSTDGSLEELREKHGWVRLIENEDNLGFSAGCNQGARAAEAPEVLVFLNNDMRVERDWLRELVGPVVRGECAAATAKMLSWDGKRMNSAAGGMNFHGIGIQKGYLEPPGPEFDVPVRSLFACGGAMAVDAAVYFELGGFDNEFFAYYEDVDLGWRMWVAGYEVHYAPRAVCYHHHSSTSKMFPPETVRLLQVRNPLLSCFKNYDDANVARVFPAQLALAVRRMMLVAGLEDDAPYRIEKASGKRAGALGKLLNRARQAAGDSVPVRREAMADLIGINDLLGNWDHWRERRAEVQARRRRSDAEIFQLFHKPLWCVEDEAKYQELHYGAADFFGVTDLFRGLTASGSEPNK